MNRPYRITLVGLVGVTALGMLTSTQAQAATCLEDAACTTTTTFDVTAGALQITVPDAADLANDGVPGGFAYGPLGAITVTDARASATPAWTASVTSGTFITGDGVDAGESITNASVYYCSGTATATTGTGTFTAGQTGCAAPPPATGQVLSAQRTAYAHTAGTGNNTATWNPQLTVAVGLDNVGGQYTGTITHTVT
ncbi:hypothetical protein [Nonomuraea sp. NEAU-A123]|uniref:hypothetical protein n=1 Tax=Nonomuraea sp. NEAU-A123 TaxID=2839649 RepID=UPI001BE3F925|nr:hypothetical protein [Nonomuraea sp. NEAU-A123]MBT2226566.1 hypothetical protein [Nonomuraea sp. NEAU-A123]